VLNELKADETNLLESKVLDKFREKYSVFYNCCKPPLMGYSGVAILTRFKPISYQLDIEGHDQEGRVITLEFETFYLVGCYVPNSG
jgi:exonuclease III